MATTINWPSADAAADLISEGNAILTTIDADTSNISTKIDAIDADTSDLQLTVGTHDSAKPTKGIVGLGVATSSAPTEVASGDAVQLWYNTFGQHIGYGSSLSNGTINTTVTNRIATFYTTNLSAVTSDTNGSTEDVSIYSGVTVYVNCSVNTGAVTITVETGHDGTNFGWTIDQRTLTATTQKYTVSITDPHKYLRVTTSTQSNSTVTATIFARG